MMIRPRARIHPLGIPEADTDRRASATLRAAQRTEGPRPAMLPRTGDGLPLPPTSLCIERTAVHSGLRAHRAQRRRTGGGMVHALVQGGTGCGEDAVGSGVRRDDEGKLQRDTETSEVGQDLERYGFFRSGQPISRRMM
jgi:hypothetical protein